VSDKFKSDIRGGKQKAIHRFIQRKRREEREWLNKKQKQDEAARVAHRTLKQREQHEERIALPILRI
jgi:hypothetical protein